MSIPLLAKPWQFDVNQFIPYQGTQTRQAQMFLWTLKQSLRNLTYAPWTVKGSSNSVAAGMDTVDRWTASTNVVFAGDGVAHSWIVLQQTGLTSVGNPATSGFQLLIDCSTTPFGDTQGGRVYVSFSAGFTGGSTTARPTATDEIGITSAHGVNTYWAGVGATVPLRLHVMQSQDGECLRVFAYQAGLTGPQCVLFIFLEKLSNPIDGLTYPVVCQWLGSSSGGSNILTLTQALNTGASSEPLTGRQSPTQFWGSFTVEGIDNDDLPTVINVQNEISGEWCMHPLGFYVKNIIGARGRHGAFFDLWMGPQAVGTGTAFPDDNTLQFVKFGPFIVPWDGETPPLLC